MWSVAASFAAARMQQQRNIREKEDEQRQRQCREVSNELLRG